MKTDWMPYTRRRWKEAINMANNAFYIKTTKGRHVFHATPASAKSTFEWITAHYRFRNKVVMHILKRCEHDEPYIVNEYEIYIEMKRP